MDEYFLNLKKEVGIDNNQGVEEEHPQLEAVKEKIRHNTNPRNFKQFWKKSENIHKSMRNRKISRKLHQEDEEAIYRQTATAKQFMSARNMRNMMRGKSSNYLEQIISSIEVVNKEALLRGKGGAHDGQANKVLSGINFIR